MSNPVQVNMYGIRYFIDGDLSDPHVKKLMVQARNDLQQMKSRNINNIPHIWLNKPNAYKVVSQFGIDSAYINVPRVEEKIKRKVEFEEKKEKKEELVEYLMAFEAYNSSKQQIGYVVCESGTFEGPYTFLETDNVIPPHATREEVAVLREANPKITVDPMHWPTWKYYEQERQFDEIELQDKEVARLYQGDEEIVYTDIACTFEQLIIAPDYWSALEINTRTLNWEIPVGKYRVHRYAYVGEHNGYPYWNVWSFGGAALAVGTGVNIEKSPTQNYFMTTDSWDEDSWDVPELSGDGGAYGLVPVPSYEEVYNYRADHTDKIFFIGPGHTADWYVGWPGGLPLGVEPSWWFLHKTDIVYGDPEVGEFSSPEEAWAWADNKWDEAYDSRDWLADLQADLEEDYSSLDYYWSYSNAYAWYRNEVDEHLSNKDSWGCAKDLDHYAWCCQSIVSIWDNETIKDFTSWPQDADGYDYGTPIGSQINDSVPTSGDQETETVWNISWYRYIEIMGPQGLERYFCYKAENEPLGYWQTSDPEKCGELIDAIVRYYQIGEDLYYVAASIEVDHYYDHSLETVDYYCFRSSIAGDVNNPSDKRMVGTSLGLGNIGVLGTGIPIPYHEIPDVFTVEDEKIYARGEFRLFKRETFKKPTEEIKKYEYEI